MAISVAQQSSFYSTHYFIGFPRPADEPDRAAVESQVKAKIAAADAAFAKRQYSTALALYLEAYGVVHRFLHPDFPVRVAVKIPELMAQVNIFEPLVNVAVHVARYPEVAEGRAPLPPVDPPGELMEIMEAYNVDARPVRTRAELAYAAATQYLGLGAVEQAQESLKLAIEHNQGRDSRLEADAFNGLGATSLMQGDTKSAASLLERAKGQYAELGMRAAAAAVDNNQGVLFTLAGDAKAAGQAFQAAGDRLPHSLGRTLQQRLNPGAADVMTRPMGTAGLDLLLPDLDGGWLQVASTTVTTGLAAETLRVQVGEGIRQIALDGDAQARLLGELYEPRLAAGDLLELAPHLDLKANFIAYLPHVYGFVLPLNIGDCYVALGRRPQAIDYYLKVLDYPYLNQSIESPAVWLRVARAVVAEADHHFRQGDAATAQSWYEEVLGADDAVPVGSRLYQPAKFVAMRDATEHAVAAMDGAVAFSGNYEIASLIAYVRSQLAKIQAGLNWLGLADDVVPIWSFDFLQATARYFAQHAIQAWREYISYRTAAEQAEMTERELEQAVTMNWYALQAQRAQEDLADAQLGVARALRDNAALHRDNLVDSRDQFNAEGWVIAELNRFQAWYANANADTVFESGHWDWGGGRELSIGEGTAQEAIDAVMRYRNRLSHGMQIDNYNRQIAEANSQITVANRQIEVAQAQRNVARWQTWAAERQYDFARENLQFFREREFTPDLYHALADRLREVANRYLDMGIYAAFLMERAYNVENDRDLRRIRFDYAAMPGAGQLTAGDSLLLDIDSFTHDLLVHIKGRRNRVRHVISLADFAPPAFVSFLQTGGMDFTIPLWVLERAYPGTYLHRIQSVEVEIEGLQVPQGITGTLTHKGISSWRRADGSVRQRITAPETRVLSGFQLRRDLALYRADPNRLGLFENSGTAASWRLELPPDTNDVDFSSISDVRLVLYFYSLHDPELEASIRTGFPTDGEAAQSFSARLHAPDEFFAFGPAPDGSNTITFALDPSVFPYNQQNLVSTQLGVQVLRYNSDGLAEPFPGVDLTLRMASQSGSGTTDGNGTLASEGAVSPLSDLIGQPLGDVEVEFTDETDDRSQVSDVFLLLNYHFDYRQ